MATVALSRWRSDNVHNIASPSADPRDLYNDILACMGNLE